jgi:5-methylcytosine-specific restriction endonuclease McrA
MPGGLDDRTYRARCKALRAQGGPCWICGKPIDLSLPYTHKDSWTADHVQARSKGGRLLGELRPACRSCNSRRGNRGTTIAAPPTTIKKW